MENFSWFSKKKKNDKRGVLVAFTLLTIFLIGKAIIDSGHLLFCIISLILGVAVYFFYDYIQKKNVLKPASLGVYSKKYPIIVQYAPPKGINPAEAGLLYNLSVEPTDLTSLIYQWKFEKLIDIKTFKGENSKKDYIKLIKLKDMPLSRPLFESEIFDSIFRMGNVKIIEGAFQLRYALMLEDLEFHGIQKGWIKTGNKKLKNVKFDNKKVETFVIILYFLMPIIATILDESGIANNISVSFFGLLWFFFIVILILVGGVLIYGNMDGRGVLKFTEKGAELASQVIGYSQFIKSCDENKIKLLLKEDPLFIDRTLPYATAFGMETEFLNQISPLKKDWNARYVKGQKIPSWIGILRFFMNDDSSLL